MTLNTADVKRATQELLEQYGEDYVYTPNVNSVGCTYGPQENGPDGCLVGLIAKRLDPNLYEDLVKADAAGDMPVWYSREVYPNVISPDENPEAIGTGIIQADDPTLVQALRFAQAMQDDKTPWGVAAQVILNHEPGTNHDARNAHNPNRDSDYGYDDEF